MSNDFKLSPSPERDWDSRTDAPLVSVCVITYNQQDYIRACLDGILMQQTDFPFEICLGEDESTDETRAICQEYADKYPGQINLILRSQSDPARAEYTSPALFNWNETLKACKGKYIATCEGDDYWIDPLKLQKQVNFLEGNEEYGLVCTNILGVDKDGREIDDFMYENRLCAEDVDVSFEDLVRDNTVFTLTTCFRASLLKAACTPMPSYGYDIWLWLRMASITKIRKQSMFTARYREHPGGISRDPTFFKLRADKVMKDCILFYWKLNGTLSGFLLRRLVRILLKDFLVLLRLWKR